MKTNFFTKLVCGISAVALVAGLAGCSGAEKKSETTRQETQKETTVKSTQKAEPVTIKFFSNVPDRSQGLGKLEQANLDSYMKENPNVTIEQEYLQDEPYKQKIQAYIASSSLPDVITSWSNMSFMYPLINGNFLAEFNKDDYKDFGFFSGALESFTFDGKLLGIPKNADFWVLYYNKEMFEKNGVKVPETIEDMLKAADAFRAKGILPCASAGKDKWPIGIDIHSIFNRVTGDPNVIIDAANGKKPFAADADLLKGAKYFKQLVDAKFFQDSFIAADYGTAKNLFVQGKTAMFSMGSWEMGMATDTNIPDNIRNNIRAVKWPAMTGEKGSVDDLAVWYGGGYSVNANSESKDEAIKLVKHLLKPENYAKAAWQEGLLFPPMKFEQFNTGNENDLQKDLVKILGDAKTGSGNVFFALRSPAFQEECQNLMQQFAAGLITPEKLLEGFDKALEKDTKK